MLSKVVGYRDFHKEEHFNFQLNRWLPYLPEQELYEVAQQIVTFEDWTRVMTDYAERAEAEGRVMNAAYYYRGAEFFMAADNPNKSRVYLKFIEMFDLITGMTPYKRVEVPYEHGFLPALVAEPEGEWAGAWKDTLVIHGGFDSFMEELYPLVSSIVEAGYRVIIFEGPGQGLPLKKFNMPMIPNWEKPVSTILDYFEIDDCTLLGISLGGCLATRAAAFESRIKRVIANDVLEDFFGVITVRVGPHKARLLNTMLKLKLKKLLNRLFLKAAKKDVVMSWALAHGQHISGMSSIYDYFMWTKQLNTYEVSHRLKQDYLLLAAREDHMIPIGQFYSQAKSLTQVRSFTGRIFTQHDHAGNHCQVGNYELANKVILDWMESLQESQEWTEL